MNERPSMRISNFPPVDTLLHDRVTLLTGRNGVGKTTLLDALSGEILLDRQGVILLDRQGVILLDRQNAMTSNRPKTASGFPFADLPDTGTVRADCAYCQQGLFSLNTLSVEENIRFARSIDGVSGPAAVGNPETALDRLESLLSERRRTRAGRLSGGECRLLSVLGTCLLRRDLYLFDEPLAGVDSANAPIVADAIGSLVPAPPNPADGPTAMAGLTEEQIHARRLRTVIVVTHGAEQAALFPGANILTLESE